MKFLLGKKLNMTEIFTDGQPRAATAVAISPAKVTQVKDEAKDGYKAIQVGFGVRKESHTAKAQRGHTKELGNFAHFREFTGSEMKVGDSVDLSNFKEGETVRVTAISKGKGHQGAVKRHGFHGGPRTHGQKHSENEVGSIGGGLRTRVPKGMRMAGRMGGEQITVSNLKILKIDSERKEIYISGAVPGRRGTIVEIRG